MLVEGPADANDRVPELGLAHRPPIAIFSHWTEGPGVSGASWTPFADFSPEWVAIRGGLRRGAEVRLIDLPSWALPPGPSRRPGARYLARLARELGADGYDALWDHLFELPLAPDALEARLARFFEDLRRADAHDQRAREDGTREDGAREDATEPTPRAREAFMAGHVAAAMARTDGPVLVVCGGLHAPALIDAWRDLPAEPPPLPAGPSARGSYLVPITFAQLDRDAGYRAGVPSPGFYQALWERGPEAAGDAMLAAVIARLREGRRGPSTADLIAARASVEQLRRIRGHVALTRVDVLDGVASAVVTRALDAPLPWTAARAGAAPTDPTVLAMLDALRGDRAGRLDPSTPRPPLVDDAHRQLAARDLALAHGPHEVTLDLRAPADLETSRVLHRLRVLEIPGVARRRGPDGPADAAVTERWELWSTRETERRLAEAAAWGPDLARAAAARLAHALDGEAAHLEALAGHLLDAAQIGIDALDEAALRRAEGVARREPRLARLGRALARTLALFRHDRLLGAAGSPALARLTRAMIRRALWLVEGARGAEAPTDRDELRALVGIRDGLRVGHALGIAPEEVIDALARVARERRSPPGLRGGAIGLLWSVNATDDAADDAADDVAVANDVDDDVAGLALDALGAASPRTIGELLAGLFALARARVLATPEVIAILDRQLAAWPEDAWLAALPSLRLAFTYFPPRERDAIARAVSGLHGRAVAREPLPADAATIARGEAREARVDAWVARYHLEGPR